MHIPVIFEDSDLLVLDKPSGIVVHPFDFSHEETVLDFLHAHYPIVFEIDNPLRLQDKRIINLGGLAHKLDRDTGGVLLVAKNNKTFATLKQLFSSHKVEKKYLALVEGKVEDDTFTIDAPLGRNKKDYKQTAHPSNPRGPLLSAITEGVVRKRNEATTLIELFPKTGRTHQLRAHMKYIGHPIVGDVAYGSHIKSDRIMLHAHAIKITANGKEREFISPLSHSFI